MDREIDNLILLSGLSPKETEEVLKDLDIKRLMAIMTKGNDYLQPLYKANSNRPELEGIVQLMVMIGMYVGKDLGDNL